MLDVYKGGNLPTLGPLIRYADAVTLSPSAPRKPPVSGGRSVMPSGS